MDLLSAIVLAIAQGLTEFWPISSSGHLILVPRFLGWEDQGLAFDVALHFGTLMAVMAYFRREVFAVPQDWLKSLVGAAHEPANARLGWSVIIATIPAGIVGLRFEEIASTEFRSALLVASTTAGYGILLWAADRFRTSRVADERTLSWRQALLIGCAQSLAIVPGTSRSGATITAGLLLGLSRRAATRFSFLLSIPIILLASLLEAWELLTVETDVAWGLISVGVVTAAATGYFCIAVLLRVVERVGMAPFAIYRLLLAALIVTTLR